MGPQGIDVHVACAHGRVHIPSMPPEHEGPDRQHQRLHPQDHGVHEPDRIDRMEHQAFGRADLS